MLTKSGFGALIVSIVLLLCGWWWHYPELLAVGAGTLAVTLVSVVAVRSRQPARIERIVPSPRVARGSQLRVEYRIDNPTRRRSPSLTIVDRLAGSKTTTRVPGLARRERTTLTAFLPAKKRGVFKVGPGSVERTDPFHLASGRRQELDASEVIVHPRVWPIDGPFGALNSPSEEAMTRSLASDPLSGFVSLREYVDGDDPRLIHWPTTARTGTLMVREHVELRRPEFTVVVDASRSIASTKDFEEIIDVAASLAVHALRNGTSVRVATTNREFVGRAQAFSRDTEVLDFLTPVTQTSREHNLHLSQVIDPSKSSGLVAFVTGPIGPSSKAGRVSEVSVIRIGKGAERAAGITTSATSAPEFAQGWR